MGTSDMATAKNPEKTSIEIIATAEMQRDRVAAEALKFLQGLVKRAETLRQDFIERISAPMKAAHTLEWYTSSMVQATLVLDEIPRVIDKIEEQPTHVHLIIEALCKHITDGLLSGRWSQSSSSQMANLKNTWEWETRAQWLETLKYFRGNFEVAGAALKSQGRKMFHVEQSATEGA